MIKVDILISIKGSRCEVFLIFCDFALLSDFFSYKSKKFSNKNVTFLNKHTLLTLFFRTKKV